ncbi:glycosyltransferase family 4 protein [Methylocaldum marinum]|uniref:glycosyltransferase family 4 protein n=1 Tax=Methylocaldum marinum TaxID=1432792 RepID=UPI001E4EE1C1|nr:glycosyltransferase family 4 protein [Methylocaldum marinum]
MKKRILFFVTEDWFVCSHWLPHVTAVRDAGYEVYVVTRVRQHRSIIEARGVHVVPLELSRRGHNPIAELRMIADLIKIYRKIRPDLVKNVAIKPVVYGTLAACFSRPRAVVNYMAGLGWLFTSDSAKARLLRPVIRAVLARLLSKGHVIVENPDDYAQMIGFGLPAARLSLIRGAGVDLGAFSPAEERDGIPLIVLPARMLWTKGVGEFVTAAERLRAEGVAARFALIGDPDPDNPASVSIAQLQTWKRKGSIEWWGRREDIPQVLAKCHIVCLPSYREGLPKALLEAAAAGKPIITTDTPGCREVVRHGDNGLLVPARDAYALAEALKTLIEDRARRERMGRRSREIAETEFSSEKITSETLDLYNAVLS